MLLGGAFIWLFQRLGQWIPRLMSHVPDWLQWLSYLLVLSVISIVLVFSYFFSTIANWIAAPFCGLLAEQLEGRLTGKPLPDSGWLGMMKDIPRIMKRELQKLGYYLRARTGPAAALFYPRFGQTVAPVLWFLFSARMLSIQYCDYPFDNHKVSFPQMRNALRQHKTANMQFGALVSLFTMIPILNLAIMPSRYAARPPCGSIATAAAACASSIMHQKPYAFLHQAYGRRLYRYTISFLPPGSEQVCSEGSQYFIQLRTGYE